LGSDCHNAKIKFNVAKCSFKTKKSEINKYLHRNANKTYKPTMNHHINVYKQMQSTYLQTCRAITDDEVRTHHRLEQFKVT